MSIPGVVTVAAVGDIMLGDSPQVFGYGVGSLISRNGADHPFAFVRDILLSADIRLGNLEVVISKFDPSTTPFPQQLYRGQPVAVDGLVTAGFNILSVCTNHTMQHGQAAFDEMLALLLNHGIQVIGAESERIGLTNATVIERNGLRLGFLGYNFRPQQYFLSPPAWPTPSFDLIRSDVASLRKRAEIIIATLHWGDEFIDRPSPSQVNLGRRLVDAGIDVIVGHHPHIAQGVERYNGGVIAYSLGNFVYDQWQKRLRESMILKLTIRGPRKITCDILPVLINSAHQPVPLEGSAATEALRSINRLESYIGISSQSAYDRQLQSSYRRFRWEIYRHYLTSFWRSRPRDLMANVTEMIRRRL